MDDFKKYLLLGILIWVVVDYTTAFNPDIQRWIDHMPLIWGFYIGYPLIFAQLIYRKRWDDRRLLLAMMVGAFTVEIVLSNNTLLYTYPLMVVMIPIAVAIYTIVTFLPKWVIDGTLKQRWKTLLIIGIVYFTVAFLNYANKTGTS